MQGLQRKSFYLDGDLVRRLAAHVYETYRRTGKRVSESEVVRAALDSYLRSSEAVADPGARPEQGRPEG